MRWNKVLLWIGGRRIVGVYSAFVFIFVVQMQRLS